LPEPSRGGPVSLDAILAYADRHAPVLQVARERLGLGDAAVAGAAPLLVDNPSLTVGAGPRITGDGTHTDLTLSLSQRFEIAGERGLRLEAAERTQGRLQAELDEARWEVHRDVHAAFHRALVARERLAAADRLLAFQERLVDISRRRLRAGDVSPLAVRLAEGELSQARVARIAAEQAHLRARFELGALAGFPAPHPPEPAGELDLPREPPNAATLTELARRHQPRLRALHAARTEAEAHSRAADRDAWPEPALGVQVTREGAPAGLEETIVLGTLSLPLPLFQRNQAARATARAEARIADAERGAFGSQLENRLEQNRTAVLAAAARVRTYGREILPTFEENLRLIQRAFELGEIDILQVSVARERFLRIQTDALDAYTDYFQAVADLEASIGTDLWPDERHEPTQSAAPGVEEQP
jgi:cobalt-zinc-cadmium efflux system outer membrane protein